MNATAIVIFPDRERAFDALKALHAASGSMAVGSIVATKELNGNLRVTETSREKLGGTIAGAFIGALAGLPVGAGATILGAATGALIGAAADILNGVDEAGHDKNIGRELKPGETALVIGVSQKNMADFEALMKSVGGTIARWPWFAFGQYEGHLANSCDRRVSRAIRSNMTAISQNRSIS